MEDKELAIRFINGGEDSLEEVIDFYSERLLRYSTSILCDYHEAEDVIQECFISAYKNRRKFDGEYLSSWLYKITYNMSLNKIKKRRTLYFSHVFSKETYEMNDEDSLSDKTLRALSKLKPQDRALVYGRVMEEMTYKDLSFQMGISEVTLRKRYERAKNKLVEELKKEDMDYGYEG